MQQQSCGGSGYYPLPPYQYKANYANVTGRSGIWPKLSRSTMIESFLVEREKDDSPSFLESQILEQTKEIEFSDVQKESNVSEDFSPKISSSSKSAELPFWVPRPPSHNFSSKASKTISSTISKDSPLPFWVPLPQPKSASESTSSPPIEP